MSALLGIDIGGTGSRVALSVGGERREFTGPRVEVRSAGDGIRRLARGLVARARAEWSEECERIAGVGLGATGLATLADAPEVLAAAISAEFGGAGSGASGSDDEGPPTAVAMDAVTAHLGALGGADGAVLALGTGAIAIGRRDGAWRRVDGWGHLLGDRGGGVWIALRALQTAMLAHDGVDESGAGLLAAAVARFGEPRSWPGRFYTRDDRAGVIAAFAAEVVALAETDEVALRIVREAAREAARSALAALDPEQEPIVAVTGGLTRSSLLMGLLEREVMAMRPDTRLRAAAGDPLDGALELAGLAAAGGAFAAEPYVWVHPQR